MQGAQATADRALVKTAPLKRSKSSSDDLALQTVDFGSILQVCATACTNGPSDIEACLTDCIVTESATGGSVGLSAGCSGCYSGLFICSAMSCGTPCQTGPSDPACVSCICTACEPRFLSCAGRASGSCG